MPSKQPSQARASVSNTYSALAGLSLSGRDWLAQRDGQNSQAARWIHGWRGGGIKREQRQRQTELLRPRCEQIGIGDDDELGYCRLTTASRQSHHQIPPIPAGSPGVSAKRLIVPVIPPPTAARHTPHRAVAAAILQSLLPLCAAATLPAL